MSDIKCYMKIIGDECTWAHFYSADNFGNFWHYQMFNSQGAILDSEYNISLFRMSQISGELEGKGFVIEKVAM